MRPSHEIGSVIAERYEVVGLLGRGGFATTYAAVDSKSGEQVALKQVWLWHQHDWKVLDLFEREARVLAQLVHPAIPRYVDSFRVDTDSGPCFYLAQALAQGRTLAVRIADGWHSGRSAARDGLRRRSGAAVLGGRRRGGGRASRSHGADR